jgi:signal transduction histidine kinase
LTADPTIGRCNAEIETACYRIVQEALNNVTKHARATDVHVKLSQSGSILNLVIRDDGVGFDVSSAQERASAGSSFGVLGMRERASLVGGTLTIESAEGQGTEIRAALPFRTTGLAEYPVATEN